MSTATTTIGNIRNTVSKDEWQARVDLAAIYAWLG
jgi:hypothetical protein